MRLLPPINIMADTCTIESRNLTDFKSDFTVHAIYHLTTICCLLQELCTGHTSIAAGQLVDKGN